MSEDNQEQAESAGAQEQAEITIDDFGVKLSRRDTRHELVNAFIFTDRCAGNHKDTEANFQARFEDFLDQPA